ncbi:uncharacterized protein DNG_00147 [Cephalotrichum gorgonifer]|uniref:Chromo domain-containing protein n=1 Tax=Cephalotrichum gorgonifer TaxID=2041049 RepID=A0AAE8MNR4_9PEZI|nr:uncharacterized protein DNG_00147 [Cephalotrichum gorgonifer]
MDGWVIRTPGPAPASTLDTKRDAPRFHHTGTSSRRPSTQSPPQLPSSRPSTRDRASAQPPSPGRPRRYRLEVQLRQADYAPPKLQTPVLLLPHDSTAYIKERMLLKSAGVAADGNPLPMKMGYLIGWSDLPRASTLVPADDVLEYVSPFALEQFEYGLWKERRREEAEAEAKRAAGQVASVKNDTVTEKKKPGRPPGKEKSRGRPRQEARTVVVDEGAIREEVRKRAGSQTREGQQPSLSTPQKTRLGAYVGVIGGGEEVEAEAAIYRQLYGDTETDAPSYPATEREESGGYDSEPPRKRLRSSSPVKVPGSSIGGVMSSRATPTPAPAQRAADESSTYMSLTSASKAEEEPSSPTITSFTPIIPSRAPHRPHHATTSSESRESSTGVQRPAKPLKSAATKKTPRKKTPKKPNTTPAAPRNGAGRDQKAAAPDEVQFEVKRLEASRSLLIDGKREWYFLVRWEGNWSPEENPTWEPEENIPATLVRKFLAKNKPKPRAGAGRKEQRPDAWPQRRYSSVLEAFEGSGLEGADGNGLLTSGGTDEDAEAGEETFQVTEGTGRSTAPDVWGSDLDFGFAEAYGVGGS